MSETSSRGGMSGARFCYGKLMRRILDGGLFFLIGGVGYGAIELLWRGHTHWSMLIAGGICFTLFAIIADRLRDRSLLFKAMLCALAVTAVELVFGIIFNMVLGLKVWDYSAMPFNFLGQICPYFTLLWGILALATIPLAEVLLHLLGE